MKKAFALLAVMFFVTGCTTSGELDQIMGRTEGSAVPEPNRIDCDLIFPGPDSR